MVNPLKSLRTGDALLLVDVPLDFLPGGSLPVPQGDRVLPVLKRWLRAATEEGVPVFTSRDWHPPDHVSFEQQGGPWPPNCVQRTQGARLHPALELPDDVVLVTKGDRTHRDQSSASTARDSPKTCGAGAWGSCGWEAWRLTCVYWPRSSTPWRRGSRWC